MALFVKLLLKDQHPIIELAAQAATCLRGHGVIACPTDTIYGLASLAQSSTAVNKLYDIKSRDYKKPISICVGDIDDVGKWGQVTVSSALLKELLPGPVTLVFERTATLNPELNPGNSRVGIRIPDFYFVRELARACSEPLALTSANVSTAPSSLSVEEFSSLWPRLDLVVDGGVLGNSPECRLGSTVVDLSTPGRYVVLRPGSALEPTTALLGRYGLVEERK